LVQSPEWVLLVKVAETQISRLRRSAECGPMLDQGACAQRDWDLAQAAGIEVALRIPESVIITALETQIAMENQNARTGSN
jgi:hypothetical protein